MSEEPSTPAIRYFGKYALLGKIAEGGMGVVYRARQVNLNKRVAVKMIHPRHVSSSDTVQRFLAEAEAMAKLSHDHIVPIYEVGKHDGQLYFSMKLLEGGNLEESLDGAPMSSLQAAQMMISIAGAVHHAHQRGILHRDLKPGNILLDEEGRPHVTDFGIAKLLDADFSQTQPGMVLGSFEYMAPELATGKAGQVTTAADVYGLGAILYAILTRVAPFSHQANETRDALLSRVINQEPFPPGSNNPLVDRDLESICLMCLEKEPRQRYSSAVALQEDLQNWIEGKPIKARPRGWVFRIWNFIKRRPAISILTAALALTIIAGFISVTYQWHRAERNANAERHSAEKAVMERDRAEEAQQEALGLFQSLALAQAETHFSDQENNLAIRQLCDVIKKVPTNRIAAERLVNALLESTYCLPVYAPIQIPNEATSIAVSPDGNFLAAAWGGSETWVWYLPKGELIAKLKHGRSQSIHVQFPQKDSQLLIKSKRDVEVWDWFLQEKLWKKSYDHSSCFSDDGTMVAIANGNNSIEVWDIQNQRSLVSWKPKSGEKLNSHLAFSSGGNLIAGRFANNNIRVFDLRQRREFGPFQHPYTPVVWNIDPSESKIMVGSYNLASTWNIDNKQISVTDFKHKDWFASLSFSPDGLKFLSAANDYSARIWSTEPIHTIFELPHHGTVLKAKFSSDGFRVVTIASDSTVRLWDAETGIPLCAPVQLPTKVIDAIVTLNGHYLIVSCNDGKIRVFDSTLGSAWSQTLIHPKADFGIKSEINKSGTHLLSTTAPGYSGDPFARIWDLNTKTAHLLAGHDGGVTGTTFSPDGSTIASADSTGSVMLRSMLSLIPYASNKISQSSIRSIQFSKHGDRLLVNSESREIAILNVPSGEQRLKKQFSSQPNLVEFNHDSNIVLVHGNGKVITLTADTLEPIFDLALDSKQVSYAKFSPADNHIAVGYNDGAVGIWNCENGELQGISNLHNQEITMLQFSPDSQRLASASRDGTVRLWTSPSVEPVGIPMEHSATIFQISFSPDGNRIVSGGISDEYTRIWDGNTGYPLSEPILLDTSAPANFSQDGRWMYSGCWDRTVDIHEVMIPTLPVPEWFLQFATELTGKIDYALKDFASPNEDPLLFWRTYAEIEHSKDFYTQFLKWFFANRSVRAISPGTSIIVPELLAQINQKTTVGTRKWQTKRLRKAVLFDTSDPVALQRYAESLDEDSTNDPRKKARSKYLRKRIVEALRIRSNSFLPSSYSRHDDVAQEPNTIMKLAKLSASNVSLTNVSELKELNFKIEKALQIAPTNAELANMAVQLWDQLANYAKASQLARTLILQDQPSFLESYARLQINNNQWNEGQRAYSRMLELAALHKSNESFQRLAVEANFMLKQISHKLELNIPIRDTKSTASHIDLQKYYNASLFEDWHGPEFEDSNLSTIPFGLQEMAGVTFDIRGIIHLSSRILNQIVYPTSPYYPSRAVSIKIGNKCRQIHFLHATSWKSNVGTLVGTYRIHYTNGTETNIPIISGQDVYDWYFQTPLPRPGKQRLRVAWEGYLSGSRSHQPVKLYITSWQNPDPYEEVESFDFVSAMEDAAPFLVAVTISP